MPTAVWVKREVRQERVPGGALDPHPDGRPVGHPRNQVGFPVAPRKADNGDGPLMDRGSSDPIAILTPRTLALAIQPLRT